MTFLKPAIGAVTDCVVEAFTQEPTKQVFLIVGFQVIVSTQCFEIQAAQKNSNALGKKGYLKMLFWA